jgi:hypothetical protein
MTQVCNASPCVPLPDALMVHDVSSRAAACMHAVVMRLREKNLTIAAWYSTTYSYDFSYRLRFGKFSGILATTGHTVESVAVCMLKYRVKITGTDKRHVVSFSKFKFRRFQCAMDFMFHEHLTAEGHAHWYSPLSN